MRGSGDRYIDSLMRKASDLVTVRNDYFWYGWTRLVCAGFYSPQIYTDGHRFGAGGSDC